MEKKQRRKEEKPRRDKGTGSIRMRIVNGKEQYSAIVTYFDAEEGKRKWKEKVGPSKAQANKKLRELLNEYEDHGAESLNYSDKTFKEFVVDWYVDHYMKPAVIHAGRKIAGLKSFDHVSYQPRLLVDFFGRKKLRSISPADIEQYK